MIGEKQTTQAAESEAFATATQAANNAEGSHSRLRSLILIIASAIFLLVLCVGTLFSEDISFSENENRYLQAAPKLTLANVMSGRFESQAEDYLNDQIIGRELWVKGMASISAGLGIGDVNGVYLCKDGRVVKRITETDFDWTLYRKNLKQVDFLKEKCEKDGKELYMMPVPTAAYVYKEYMPRDAMCFDEEQAFAEAEAALGSGLIDLRTTMRAAVSDGSAEKLSADGGVYFRTDHHWSGYGAYLGYRGFSEACGHDMQVGVIPSYEETEPLVLSDDFYGTLYSKVLLSGLKKDSVETPKAALEAKYEVKLNGESYSSLYFNEYLAKKDKYAVFFGGNYDKVDIETEEGREKGSLLILKDSFANSFVPYILGDYEKITMIDSRYYRGNIEELAAEYDRILVLYGIDNFAGEKLRLDSAGLK